MENLSSLDFGLCVNCRLLSKARPSRVTDGNDSRAWWSQRVEIQNQIDVWLRSTHALLHGLEPSATGDCRITRHQEAAR
jgi:hypothetical protein